MKNQKGITLIALVVTIVVLLILAGVAIAMLRGDNGILTKATKAASETKIAEAREAINNAINEGTTAYYDKKYVTKSFTTEESSHSSSVQDYVGYYLKSSGKLTSYVDNATDNIVLTSASLVVNTKADYGSKTYTYHITGDKAGQLEEN